ncbi:MULTISPECIES: hypothetical protein [Actinotignum]|uniref:Uncharacterized protein n=1 Tax=Actinotignum timonense TaxID=1870995 RepID=A0AAW9HMQ8_9ACTO|nr:hypothetical protein [Actinotignum timonense]MDK6372758.1 hypothetical protein [Actinotignum timonense]MDK6419650.1 hypothetical protein [Actinotignum timonense]MDK6589485.1 hypothetical protein [Actinotignum timonense]MDK6628966.1 hypothetical protein [Actinotignum timonense]MDK6645943.1 hypothetical protein [Actinotignum timonense]
MVNARLNECTDEFAAHLQRIGELIDPSFSLVKQETARGAFPSKRLFGDIRVDRFLFVRFDYEVFLNSKTGLLSVNESTFSVIRGAKNSEPLVRWDYIRSPRSSIPCAHIQIHSHRDEWTPESCNLSAPVVHAHGKFARLAQYELRDSNATACRASDTIAPQSTPAPLGQA